MSLLRIYGSLADQPQRCQWALVNEHRAPVAGEGRLADLPQRAGQVHLVLPATEVLITRARLPHGARRGSGAMLAFAVEEKAAGEPDANQVSWLGSVGDEDALAVADKAGLERWHQALAAVGIRVDAVHCETLLLPLEPGEWSVAWNGSEGFVRTGEFEGAATDCGDRDEPPMSLRLMIEEARAHGAGPATMALYATAPDAAPDIDAWQRELGVDLRLAGSWDWRSAAPDAGVGLAQEPQRWRIFSGAARRLRPAAWILGAALTLHGVALVTDWTLAAGDQRALRLRMDAQFRAAFPEAVAVADPALQMRRKLAEARHAAGLSDGGDFLPMIERVATAAKDLPAGAVRVVSYEGGRMTLELTKTDEAALRRIRERLLQAGLSADASSAASGGGRVLIVREAS